MNIPSSLNRLSRRRFVQWLAMAPWLYPSASGIAGTLPAAPDLRRIVALEWLPIELLQALGVAPYGVAEIATWREWVGEPALPADTIDVGLRTEPNMELLVQMAPSLILYSQGFGPGPDKLERIAPTFGVRFSDGTAPLTTARQSLRALGARLGREREAEKHLAQFDSFMAEMRDKLAAYRGRPLLLMTLMDARHALVIGRNSLFSQVMDQLGLEIAWQGEVNFWGSAVVGIERLAEVNTRDVVC